LRAPSAIRAATDEYLNAEDSVGTWLAEATTSGGQVTLKAAHNSYRAWCEENSQQALGRNAFADKLRSTGQPVELDSHSRVNVIAGIQLVSQANDWSRHAE
jgi:phage/plasmid-associated DNA primase